jgi:gamma-glutamyltranspeptidase/glutathione hydrolase
MYKVLMRFSGVLSAGVFLFCFLGSYAQSVSPAFFAKEAVVCAHPLAAEAGAEVLRSGGNAADAALAVHMALAVVYPSAGNLGGGGFALYRSTAGEYDFLDFRETAPAKATKAMFLDKSGNPVPDMSTASRAAAGTPGSVAGIFNLQQKYGRLSPKYLLNFAVRLAEKGFPVTRIQATELTEYAAEFRERNANSYFQNNAGWKEGDTLRQPDLAQTIRRIQSKGKDGFYRGRVASLIIREMGRGNGLMTKKDLRTYTPVWRKPIYGEYKDHRVVSAPPPSAGGIALLQMLRMAELTDFSRFYFKSPEDVFYATEIERFAYADRAMYAGDPDFVSIPVDSLLDDAYLQSRFASISPMHPNRSEDILPAKFHLPESDHTTHFSIVDAEGNAVAITTTLNDHYGSKISVTGAGFLLNNEMDDFSIKPGVANLYGLTGMDANAVAPGKRMLSSMTPTMVEKDGKLLMVLGTPGGSTIITTVFRLILSVIDFKKTLSEAVAEKRFHHQWVPDLIFHEEGAFSPELREELMRMGYMLQQRGYIGRADCISVGADGMLEAAPDPRGDDAAAGR